MARREVARKTSPKGMLMEQRSLGKASAVLLFATGLTLLGSCSPQASARRTPAPVAERLGGLAVPFIENAGQSDPRVAYSARTFSGTVFVTRRGEIVYALPGAERVGDGRQGPTAPAPGWTLTESFVDGQPAPVAAHPAATHVSLFLSNDRARWYPHVATYADVDLGAVWPGIGVTLKAYGKQMEKVFTVEPGAAPETIRMRVAGTQGLAVSADGSLAVRTGVGDVRLTRPVAYQEVAGTRRMLDVTYRVAGDEYGFRLAGYDATRPVVIDPLLQATYLGGNGNNNPFLGFSEFATALATAPTGEVYVAGRTDATDFPGTSGGAQSACATDGSGNCGDAFIVRLNASLTAIDQAVYLGGTGGDAAVGLAIAPTTGEVYVAGGTSSTDFPGTSGGAQTAFGPVFVARLNASLTALDQATYYGVSGVSPSALAIAPTTGEVYVAGSTSATNLPGTSGGAQSAYGGGFSDVFIARLNASLTALDQATYLGGTSSDSLGLGGALAIGPTGEVYVTGDTISTDFPGTSGGAQSAFAGGGSDAFVARLNASLTALDQATYLGGSGAAADPDIAQALAIAPTTGDIYVAGQTESTDFPGTSGGAQSTLVGVDAFVARLNASLTALDQATYLGGGSSEVALALAIAPTTGEVYVAGQTQSTDFPGTSGGAQNVCGGTAGSCADAFVARLNPSLTVLDQATYLGGSDGDVGPFGGDSAAALALAPTGEVYVAGRTSSIDFPGTSGGAQDTFGGGLSDAFVARLSADLGGGPINNPRPMGALKCYKTKDPRSRSAYTFDLMAGVSGFPDELGCTLKLGAKRICVEVNRGNFPPRPASVFLSYKIKCPAAAVAPQMFDDQFGPALFPVGKASELLVPALPGPSNDHLKCYRTKDPRPKARYTVDLLAGVTGFANEPGCTVRLGAKRVCVQVNKQNVTPEPPGGGPAPGPESGAKLVSYKLRCPKRSQPSVTATDQFGSGTLTPGKVDTLLVPASPSGAFLGGSSVF
jgi:hypothetical protein